MAYPNYTPHFSNVINLDKKRFACFPLSTIRHYRSYFTRAQRTAVFTLAANVTSISVLGPNPQNQTNPPANNIHRQTLPHHQKYVTAVRINQLQKAPYNPPPLLPQRIQKATATVRARARVRMATEPMTMPQTA